MGELVAELNRLAGTTGLEAAGAANEWAGTQGLELVGALNAKAGTSGLELLGVLNVLAGTKGLGANEAATRISGAGAFEAELDLALIGFNDAEVTFDGFLLEIETDAPGVRFDSTLAGFNEVSALFSAPSIDFDSPLVGSNGEVT